MINKPKNGIRKLHYFPGKYLIALVIFYKHL